MHYFSYSVGMVVQSPKLISRKLLVVSDASKQIIGLHKKVEESMSNI